MILIPVLDQVRSILEASFYRILVLFVEPRGVISEKAGATGQDFGPSGQQSREETSYVMFFRRLLAPCGLPSGAKERQKDPTGVQKGAKMTPDAPQCRL